MADLIRAFRNRPHSEGLSDIRSKVNVEHLRMDRAGVGFRTSGEPERIVQSRLTTVRVKRISGPNEPLDAGD
jgi:hypothetical protein